MRIKDLKPNPKNPRKITDAKLSQLKKSMAEFGDLSGIVFNRRSGNLIGGHQRSKNLDIQAKVHATYLDKPTKVGTVAEGYIQQNDERFSYREVDWPEAKEKAANIAANKGAGEFDTEALTEWLKELNSFDVGMDMDLTMFDGEELATLGIGDEIDVAAHTRSLATADDEVEEDPEPPEEPEKLQGEIQLFNADNLEVMRSIPANTFDSIVTDPPYGWRFMGKAWDGADIVSKAKMSHEEKRFVGSDGKERKRNEVRVAQSAGMYDLSNDGNKAFQVFSETWAREAYRVLKPGGHMIVFCGPRTYHRMAAGVEDAGFEVRDQMQWIFGQGFPKSLDISKAIDRAAGVLRTEKRVDIRGDAFGASNEKAQDGREKHMDYAVTAPATEDAQTWEGWGTALKPANEPILLARKPLSEKTVAANVLKWGTGGLNIDGCRIGSGVERDKFVMMGDDESNENSTVFTGRGSKTQEGTTTGRFPGNVIFDKDAGEMLDAQSGFSKSPTTTGRGQSKACYRLPGQGVQPAPGDSGGASRFFYCPKTSTTERNTHCAELETKDVHRYGAGLGEGTDPDAPAKDKNHHPTVKPVSLMRYLARLVTPANGLVLDPFMGSGSTGVAALREEFRFVGIELEAEYFKICKKRLNYKNTKTELVVKRKAAKQS